MKVFIRQTAMAAYHWQLFNTTTSSLVAQSIEYGTRAEAVDAANNMAKLWAEGYDNLVDQTPEAKRGL